MASEGGSRFKLLTPAELDSLPPPSWLIEGILPAHAVVTLYGLPGAKKTFVALSMALSIAAGHPWCGQPTSLGAVLYIAAEGLPGLHLRVKAYQVKHGIVVEQIRYLGETFDLRLPADIEQLVSSIGAADFHPNLIVLDTLARFTPGAEENSSKDMGEVVRATDNLRRRFGATVMLVHHTGKNGDSERGSSALRGAADTMIKCSAAPGHVVSLRCDKIRDFEPFQSATLRLERIEINASASSLAVANFLAVPDIDTDQGNVALELLKAEFRSSGATHKQWLDVFLGRTGRSKSSFEREVKKLKETGAVRQEGVMYYANSGTDGVRCQEVSTRCHDTPNDGVMSSPPLGDDTDTGAPGQK